MGKTRSAPAGRTRRGGAAPAAPEAVQPEPVAALPREHWWPHWRPAIGLYVSAVLVYALLGTLKAVPLVQPDEFIYGHLSQSVAHGDGLTWRGDGAAWRSLYIYLLAPSWLLGGTVNGYHVAKLWSAVMVCTVVFPVWGLARTALSARLALVPAVLVLAGTWMISAGSLLTENLALPLTTAALASMVLALRRPASRWFWAALGFALLAAAARTQLIVLLPILVLALALDVAWSPDRRARIGAHRAPLIALGGFAAAGLLLLAVSRGTIVGSYGEVQDYRPPLGTLLKAIGRGWIDVAVMSAVLPLGALLALAGMRRSWRDPQLGPLLTVALAATLLFVVESAFFVAGNAGTRGSGNLVIERYVEYAVPLLLVLLITALALGRLPLRWLLGGSAFVALTLFAAPPLRRVFEVDALYAVWALAHSLVSSGLGLGLFGLLLTGAAALLARRLTGERFVLAVGGLLLVTLVALSQSVWRLENRLGDAVRSQYPADLAWIDHHARTPVTRMSRYSSSPLFERAAFFNRDVAQVLLPPGQLIGSAPLGRNCGWFVDPRGTMQTTGGCGPIRRVIWNDDSIARFSFYGGRTIASDAHLGQLIGVPAAPRLRSIMTLPCQRPSLLVNRAHTSYSRPRSVRCSPFMSTVLFLDGPATVRFTFAGGSAVHHVRSGTRRWTLLAGRATTLSIPVAFASGTVPLYTDWRTSAGAPVLTAATLESSQGSASLL